MQKTVNYNLNKPEYSEQYDLRHWNDNSDIIDAQMKAEETARIQNDALKENLSNKVTSFGSTPSDTKYPSEKLVKDNLDLKENHSNLVTSFQTTPDNTHYPSEKLVKDYVDGEISSLEDAVEDRIIAHGAEYDDDGNFIRDFYEWKNRKVSSWSSTPNDTHYPTEKLVKDSLDDKENLSNKKSSFGENPSDDEYPTLKLVKDSLNDMDDDINDLEASITIKKLSTVFYSLSSQQEKTLDDMIVGEMRFVSVYGDFSSTQANARAWVKLPTTANRYYRIMPMFLGSSISTMYPDLTRLQKFYDSSKNEHYLSSTIIGGGIGNYICYLYGQDSMTFLIYRFS